jgi:ethanolamine utilization cobalamin adenosyltransferase
MESFMKKIQVPLDELLNIYDLLEELNELFHQPLNYEDQEHVCKFADKNYQRIHELYYNTV